jgi:hypothetical protein
MVQADYKMEGDQDAEENWQETRGNLETKPAKLVS